MRSSWLHTKILIFSCHFINKCFYFINHFIKQINLFLFCITLILFLIAHSRALFLIIISFFFAPIFLFWFMSHFKVHQLIFHHISIFVMNSYHLFIYSNKVKQFDQIISFIVPAQIFVSCHLLKLSVKNLNFYLINLFCQTYLKYNFIFTILTHLINRVY